MRFTETRSLQIAAIALGAMSLAVAQLPAQEPATTQPYLQVQAGALNPDDLAAATMAFGVSAGVTRPDYGLGLHLTRQSQNRNSGADLGANARTFATASFDWRIGRPRGPQQRRAFGRVEVGVVFRSPFKTVLVTGGGVVWRIPLARRLRVVGALFDYVAWLADEVFACQGPLPLGPPSTCHIAQDPQHNFGGTIALQVHP